MSKNVWIASMEILSHSRDIVYIFELVCPDCYAKKGLRFFAVIYNQSQKCSILWLAYRRLLSGHIYAVSHDLPTEKCWS